MKKMAKILKVIILIIIVINIGEMFRIKCFAMTDVTEDPDTWQPMEEENVSLGKFDRVADRIASTVKLIGVLVSVGTLSVIGIKFMLGSVEEKAQYKQTMIPWIIGACMVFAMTLIPDMIYSIVNSKAEYNANPAVGGEYFTGYLSGYNEGIMFWRSWTGDQSTLDAKRKYYEDLLRTSAETNGKADGGMDALESERDMNFCNGYSKAASWIQSENPNADKIRERINNPEPGMTSKEILGYNQRLQLQLNILNSY